MELITCRSRWLCYKLDNVVVSDEILNIRKGELGMIGGTLNFIGSKSSVIFCKNIKSTVDEANLL